MTAHDALTVHASGGPTAVLEIGGLRLVTDPTFDDAREYRSPTTGASLVKTSGSALTPDGVGAVDAVLLSHDEHPDNLDVSGREFLKRAPIVITTPGGAERLGGAARGLAPWEHVDLPRPGGGELRVTGVPAQHGPEGCEPITGEVVGFVLTAPGLPTVYVSGDNASLEVVHRIAGRFPSVDTALLFAGAARTFLFDGALLTLDSAGAAEAARILGVRRVVPLTTRAGGTSPRAPRRCGRRRGGRAGQRLTLIPPGRTATL